MPDPNVNRNGDARDIISAYLDGQLSLQQRQAFEHSIAQRGEASQELSCQLAVNAAMTRIFEPPADSALRQLVRRVLADHAHQARSQAADGSSAAAAPAAPSDEAVTTPGHKYETEKSSASKGRVLKLAAVIAIFTGSVWLAASYLTGSTGFWPFRSPSTVPEVTSSDLVFDHAFAHFADRGFAAEWVCDTEQEFTQAFAYRLRQGLRLGELPANVTASGLAYRRILSQRSVCVLFGIGPSDHALVIVDRLANDDPDLITRSLQNNGQSLHVSRRVIDQLVLYEISTQAGPVALPWFAPGR